MKPHLAPSKALRDLTRAGPPYALPRFHPRDDPARIRPAGDWLLGEWNRPLRPD